MISFNESMLFDSLSELGSAHRAAFSAACATRLLAGCKAISKAKQRVDPEVEVFLSRAWDHIDGESVMSKDALIKHIAECESKIQESDGLMVGAVAEDAAASIAFTLRCIASGSPQDAVWAARRGYDAVDLVAQELADQDGSPLRTEDEILAAQIVQAELGRQVRDLADVSSKMSVRELRQRATAEGASMFEGGR